METVAVYWEKIVQIYGITEKHDLCLGKLCFLPEHAEKWGNHIADLQVITGKFEFVTMHARETDKMELLFVFEQNRQEALAGQINTWVTEDNREHFSTLFPVDIIYLHGPHFQDRFGIAESAFTALEKRSEKTLLAAGCAGTSMYLVTPGGNGKQITQLLTDTFFIPTSG